MKTCAEPTWNNSLAKKTTWRIRPRDENIDPVVKEYVSVIIVKCQGIEYQCWRVMVVSPLVSL